ncbi:MAG: ribonuclease R [Eubacteriales bacterium]|nr:ribonuclease R [Lachnospiraceae bacterium]MDO5127757.1 ribonuclease R [Eubacteriales bacterium]
MGEKREIIKEKLYGFICDDQYKPMRLKDIRFLLQVSDSDKKRVEDALNELISEGKITVTPKGKYKKLDDNLLVGTYIGNKKGFGFVRVEGIKEDFFIPAKYSMDAFHNDRVVICPEASSKTGKRMEAKIVNVLERGMTVVVGTFERQDGYGFVIPDNQKVADDIFINKKDTMSAMTGHKVVCQITNYGEKGKSPEGKIVEILGHVNDPSTDLLSVVRAYDIPMEYPEKVMNSLNDILDEVSPEELEGRTDFRDLLTVTIDGEDAKDLDDAISISYEDGIYTLGVHIADVSHYVTEKSPLDKEALKRGTSCYLIDSVIPMIPHKLSNGICSLNAGVDRLTLSCVMKINQKGKVIDHTVCEGVIHVDERMSYTNVQKILDRSDEEVLERYKHIISMCDLMFELSQIIRECRHKRGSIDFDVDETKIIVDENHKPVQIKAYDRNPATRIIEDFMLMANETIAEDYFWQQIPFEYRIHESPDPEKIDNLTVFLNNFGLFIRPSQDEVHPKELQKILKKIEGEPYEALISKMMLRSMKQARYSTECSGHFGLSCKYYCHFTSPIRRYPDLQIHRIIKENIHGQLDEKRIRHYERILPGVANDNSAKERRAEEAEREVIKLKEIEYMSEHIGENFAGVVSGVTSNYVFVELENTVEGAVSIAYMYDDCYYFHEELYAVIGEQSGKKYQLGDKVSIKVLRCDKIKKTIDFSFVDDNIEEAE